MGSHLLPRTARPDAPPPQRGLVRARACLGRGRRAGRARAAVRQRPAQARAPAAQRGVRARVPQTARPEVS